jgi:hypothetical protein
MAHTVGASIIAGVLLLTGCAHGRSAHETRRAATKLTAGGLPALRCGDYIDTRPPPTGWQVVLGVSALPTAPNSPALQTGRSGLPEPAARLFAKTGLLIRAGSTFQLVVPAALAHRLAIGWGSSASPAKGVAVNGCRPRTPGGSGWLAYAGGFWLPHPACVSLLVETDGRKARVPFGLGTPCRGQKPPQRPTES